MEIGGARSGRRGGRDAPRSEARGRAGRPQTALRIPRSSPGRCASSSGPSWSGAGEAVQASCAARGSTARSSPPPAPARGGPTGAGARTAQPGAWGTRAAPGCSTKSTCGTCGSGRLGRDPGRPPGPSSLVVSRSNVASSSTRRGGLPFEPATLLGGALELGLDDVGRARQGSHRRECPTGRWCRALPVRSPAHSHAARDRRPQLIPAFSAYARISTRCSAHFFGLHHHRSVVAGLRAAGLRSQTSTIRICAMPSLIIPRPWCRLAPDGGAGPQTLLAGSPGSSWCPSPVLVLGAAAGSLGAPAVHAVIATQLSTTPPRLRAVRRDRRRGDPTCRSASPASGSPSWVPCSGRWSSRA